MKTAALLVRVREAIRAAKLETASFGNVCADQPSMRNAPVRLKDGRVVTEANVTEFIRERVKLHHTTWVIGPLLGVEADLQSELAHKFEPEVYPSGFVSLCCKCCSRVRSHRSHKK